MSQEASLYSKNEDLEREREIEACHADIEECGDQCS